MTNAGARNRKLAAKAARRKAVVAAKKKAEIASRGLGERIRVATAGPIVRCLVPPRLFEVGIGHVILARSLPSGLLGCGFFLVDTFCLGVKDAFYRELGRDELQSRLEAQTAHQTFGEADPALGRRLVREAAAYAAGLGLPPPKDFGVIERIFGTVDASACTETFTFGKDGKPFYIRGPHDTPARAKAICRTLQERCGDGGWDFLVAGAPDFFDGDFGLIEEEEEEEEEKEEEEEAQEP